MVTAWVAMVTVKVVEMAVAAAPPMPMGVLAAMVSAMVVEMVAAMVEGR